MNATRRAALVLALSLAACNRTEKKAEPPAPREVPVQPSSDAQVVTGNVKAFPPIPGVKIEFPLPEGTKPPPPPNPAALPPEAEVEAVGRVTGVPQDTELRILISRKPCTATDTGGHFGVERPKNLGPTSPFFIEVFVPQGSEGHACAYAIREGKVRAFGRAKNNPMKMQGLGEVVFSDLEIPLEPISPPAPLPAGL